MNGRIRVEVERCVACKRCVLACAVEHSTSRDMLTAMTEHPLPRSRVRLVSVEGVAIPIGCRHCDAAACVAACPTGAMHKQGAIGPVLLADQRCVGCGLCVLACPFGVIDQDPLTRRVTKCDLCSRRLSEDRIPACVESCPTGCLDFYQDGELRSWLKEIGLSQSVRIEQHARIVEHG